MSKIFSYEPCDGQIVKVETYLRNGLQVYDILGLSDSDTTSKKLKVAIKNQALDNPDGRCLVSVEPVKLKKHSQNMEFAMALSIQATIHNKNPEKILALGTLDLTGEIKPITEISSVIKIAKENGIKKIICHPDNANEIKDSEEIVICSVETLKEASKKI